jgi:replication factor A1
MTNETVIEPCHEQVENLPTIQLKIVPLSELADKNANEMVDVIGVVKSFGEVSTIVTKATNKELTKREITLVDDSNASINCTLWGKQVSLIFDLF